MKIGLTLLSILSFSASAAVSQADLGGYKLELTSACPEPMRFAIRHQAPGKDWSSKSWWSIEPGYTLRITDKGAPLLHVVKDFQLYLYAETVGGAAFSVLTPSLKTTTRFGCWRKLMSMAAQ